MAIFCGYNWVMSRGFLFFVVVVILVADGIALNRVFSEEKNNYFAEFSLLLLSLPVLILMIYFSHREK